jgi:uncharacterized protein (TIGR02996 family)
MTDSEFLCAIRVDPDNDAPRLIYADWLDEHERPARAEFIRLQVEGEGLPWFDVRRFCTNLRLEEIIARDPSFHDDLPEWAAKVCDTARHQSYRRGLPTLICCDPEDWLRHGHEILARYPVEEVQFSWYRLKPLLKKWLDSPLTRKVKRWGLAGQYLEDDDIVTIASHPAMAGVEKLDLSHNYFGDGGAEALARSAYLTSVREIDFLVTSVGPIGFRSITQSAKLPSLARLEFGHNNCAVGDKDLADLVKSSHRYEKLALYAAQVTDAGVECMCRAPCVTALRHLDLGGNAITATGAGAIANCLTGLEILQLGGTGVGDAGASAIARSPNLGNLRYLNLQRSNVGSSGGAAFGRDSTLANLCELDLCHNLIGDDAVVAMTKVQRPARLLDLRLKACGLTSAALKAVADSPFMAGLIRLDLSSNYTSVEGQLIRDESSNKIDDTGVIALARSNHIKGLRLLILHANQVTSDGAAALAQSSNLGTMRIMHLGHNAIDDTGALTFLDAKVPADCNLVFHGNPISDPAWKKLETKYGERFTLYYADDLLSIPQPTGNLHTKAN